MVPFLDTSCTSLFAECPGPSSSTLHPHMALDGLFCQWMLRTRQQVTNTTVQRNQFSSYQKYHQLFDDESFGPGSFLRNVFEKVRAYFFPIFPPLTKP